MDRNLVLFTLSLACFWLILDEFVGTKKISGILAGIMAGGERDYGDSGGQVGIVPFLDPPKDDPNDPTDDPVDKNNPFSDSDVKRGRLTSTDYLIKDRFLGGGGSVLV
jgi:hypothetical protein